MRFDFHFFITASRRRALRAFGVALALVACQPVGPDWGSCEYDPPCSQLEYRLAAWHPLGATLSPDSTGAARLDSLPVVFRMEEDRNIPNAAIPRGRPGWAFALSCAPCPADFEADSVFFTSDFVGPNGDTLLAGTLLDSSATPLGLQFRGSDWVRVDSGAFRDSVFELHVRGKIDGVPKAATLRVFVGNTLRAP